MKEIKFVRLLRLILQYSIAFLLSYIWCTVCAEDLSCSQFWPLTPIRALVDRQRLRWSAAVSQGTMGSYVRDLRLLFISLFMNLPLLPLLCHCQFTCRKILLLISRDLPQVLPRQSLEETQRNSTVCPEMTHLVIRKRRINIVSMMVMMIRITFLKCPLQSQMLCEVICIHHFISSFQIASKEVFFPFQR